jgi:inorganic pyrophosphatase
MAERGEADDKIIAVLLGDPTYGGLTDVSDAPRAVVDRLRHYFLTYTTIPGEEHSTITVDPVYGAATARDILDAARRDYHEQFGARPTRAGRDGDGTAARRSKNPPRPARAAGNLKR